MTAMLPLQIYIQFSLTDDLNRYKQVDLPTMLLISPKKEHSVNAEAEITSEILLLTQDLET